MIKFFTKIFFAITLLFPLSSHSEDYKVIKKLPQWEIIKADNFCYMASKFLDGTMLAFYAYNKSTYSMGILNLNWNLIPGEYDITVTFSNSYERKFHFRVSRKNMVAILNREDIDALKSSVGILIKSNETPVIGLPNDLALGINNVNEALTETIACLNVKTDKKEYNPL